VPECFESVVVRAYIILRQGEVDGHPAQKPLSRQTVQAFALGQQHARQGSGYALLPSIVLEGIREHVFIVGSADIMQAGLGNNDRPFRASFTQAAKHVVQSVLRNIGHADHSNDKLGLSLAKRNILLRLIGHLAQPLRIEKPDNRRLLGKVIKPGRPRTRLKPIPDLRVRTTGQGTNNRRLASLRFPE